MSSSEAQKRQAVETHSQQADQFARSYVHLSEEHYQNCFAYSRHRLEALLARYLPAQGGGRRLLDVGCGTGHHLASLRARGFEVAGVDGSEAMLEHARRNNPGVDLRQCDVERLPHPDAQFDLVLCVEVLRYLPHMDACLREIARVLRPGGVALVTAAPRFNLNGFWPVNRLATLVPGLKLTPLRQYFTTSAGLRRALRAAGFAEATIHGVYLGPLNWVERLAPRALPRLLRAWEPRDAALADQPLLRDFSNMFLAVGTR
ncbi:MAG TPA: class I SAM-dependent methyltransferase [Vicinamibacteria bacterium]